MRAPILRAWTGVIVDNFAGGGGASAGIEAALGRSPDLAINHNPIALGVHAANHPTTRHLVESVWHVDPVEATHGRPVDLAWFSPDCRHFSRAKGAPLRDQRIRGLAWSAVRWAASSARPRVIVLENVPEFATWGPLVDGVPCDRRRGQTFRAFVRRLQRLGYLVDWTTLRASDFGAATTRRRLFLVARRDGAPVRWPVGDPRSGRSAGSVIDWTVHLPSIFERSSPYSTPTLARVVEGYGLVVPFVVKHYSARTTGGHNTSASASAPLGAITTRDHHAIAASYCDGTGRRDHRAEVAALLGAEAVDAGIVDVGMRYLTPSELFSAQGFAPSFVFDRTADGTAIGKTDQVKLVGNSVCPPVAAAVVRAQLDEAR